LQPTCGAPYFRADVAVEERRTRLNSGVRPPRHRYRQKVIDTRLAGKAVLITGGNSGIGAATVRAFAAQGASLVLHYLEAATPPLDPATRIEHTQLGRPAADTLAHEITAAGGICVPLAADLSDAAAVLRLFDEAEEQVGAVEVLINNAAHCETPDTILQVSHGTIDRHFAVNTRAPALLIQEFAHRYKQRGATYGRIINVSTDAARAFASQIAYGASKAALDALTRSISIELGPLGITVNAVAPGPVQTGWITPEIEAEVLPSIPLRRVGSPEEIADVIVFLASEQARWVTGQVVQVAGGHAL
jgi:3-oxoacyl-[acyl-carrier protein] reductase